MQPQAETGREKRDRASGMPRRVLSAIDISKTYQASTVLNAVSLSIVPGEILAFLGPNGAGKSTLFRLLTGEERPSSGRVVIDGVDATDLPPHGRARCGLRYLPQDNSCFRGLTVEDNLLLSAQAADPHGEHHRAQADALLVRFGLDALRRKRPDQLSGGERRRCEIARALIGNPRYLLLDEPFAALDPIAISMTADILLGLKRMGLGILICDHDVTTALRIAGRVLVIDAGQTLASGTVDEIRSNPTVRGLWLPESFRL